MDKRFIVVLPMLARMAFTLLFSKGRREHAHGRAEGDDRCSPSPTAMLCFSTQVGLRAFEWMRDHPAVSPSHIARMQWLTIRPFNIEVLDYRCGGSAGIVRPGFRGLTHRLPMIVACGGGHLWERAR
jgi:hypothetical protein